MALITDEYRELNRQLHDTSPLFGAGAWLRTDPHIEGLMKKYDSVLDYGCGKAALHTKYRHVRNYDPAIPKYSAPPEPADLVVCRDVLEHVEEECLDEVLEHIKSLARKEVYFVIAVRLSGQFLPDGRNTHITVHDQAWWTEKVGKYFKIRDSYTRRLKEFTIRCESYSSSTE